MGDPMPPHSDHMTLVSLLASLERRVAQLEAPTGGEQAQTLKHVADTMNRLPVVSMPTAHTDGFALKDGWATYTSATLTVPASKTHATITGIAAAGVLDTTTGGATVAHARVTIARFVGETFPASKDTGASHTNNVIYATHTHAFDVAPGDLIHVSLQVKPLNATAFGAHPQNFAHITAIASFTGNVTARETT